MTKRLTTVLAVLCAISTIGATALAAAQGPRRGGPHGPEFGRGPGGPGPGHMLERLDLTEDQRAQLQALHESERETLKPLHDALRQAHEAFEQALESKTPDPAEVGKTALKMRDARRSLEGARQASLEKVKALLTPEQRQKLELMEELGFGPGQRGPRAGGAHRRNN